MSSTLAYVAFGLILVLSMIRHVRRMHRKEATALAAAERGKLRSDGPRAQHPHIDATQCIGCGACVEVCPEGDVLAVIGGKAGIVNGHKCIGHGLCAEVCPVGAITIVMASPSVGADMPALTPEHETNVTNMFIVGELGGLALIKKAADGIFTVRTPKGQYRAWTVILALGRRGTPRKLDIKGEDLPKVMYSLIEADAYTGAKIVVVGGGDSAVEAAMGLAHQKGNHVTLSYRREAFSRIKERNTQRLPEYTKSGKLTVIFNSQPVEIREKSLLMDVAGQVREIPNDYVWVFAGGTPPNEFLQKVGVQLGPRDLTNEASAEAKLA